MISRIFTITIFSFLALTLAHPLRRHSKFLLPSVARNGIPVHGNWCGPGHGGSSTNDIPCIDDIDCKCRAHDLCYDEHGDLNCKCDNDLVNSLRGDSSALATTIREYFAVSPCFSPERVIVLETCRKCVRILGRRVCQSYPCGFTHECQNVPIAVNKGSIETYGC